MACIRVSLIKLLYSIEENESRIIEALYKEGFSVDVLFQKGNKSHTNYLKSLGNRKNYNFTYLKSTTSLASMRIFTLPTTVIFNEDGKKVKTMVGAIQWDSKQMIKKLKAL